MKIQYTNRREVFIFGFLGIALIIFALLLDWQYDEAWTYEGVSDNTLWNLLTYSKFKFANNHLLNSIYFHFLQKGNLTNVFLYRILSLGSFGLFFYANYRILKQLKINTNYIVILMIAPYFLHFGMGRGYSIAMACFSMSLLYLIKYIESPKTKYEYLLVLFGAISCLSLFSFLYCFAPVILIYTYFKLKNIRTIHTLVLYALVILTLTYTYYAGKLVNLYDPNILGTNNLLKNGTLSSLVSDFSNYTELHTYLLYKYYKLLITICLVVPFAWVFINIRKSGFNLSLILKDKQTILIALFILSLFLMSVAHFIFQAKYPVSRAVFYLDYLLLIILLATKQISKKYLFYIPLAILFLASISQVIYSFYNLSKTSINKVLTETKNNPIYVTNHNPNVKLINKLDKINKENIIQGKPIKEINALLTKDSSKVKYIFCSDNEIDSVTAQKEKIFDCRNHFVLYKVTE